MSISKPTLSFWQIINMNVGFFGIQYSFGLQQSAVNPIYDFLGAKPDEIIPTSDFQEVLDIEHMKERLKKLREKGLVK